MFYTHKIVWKQRDQCILKIGIAFVLLYVFSNVMKPVSAKLIVDDTT